MKLSALLLGVGLSTVVVTLPSPPFPRASRSNTVTKTIDKTRYVSSGNGIPAILDVIQIKTILRKLPRGISSSVAQNSKPAKSLGWLPKTQDLPSHMSPLQVARPSSSAKSHVHSARALTLHETASLTQKLKTPTLTGEFAVQTLTLKPIELSSYGFDSYDFDVNAIGHFIMYTNDTELHVPFPMPVAASLCRLVGEHQPNNNESTSISISHSGKSHATSKTTPTPRTSKWSPQRQTSAQTEKSITELWTAIMSSMIPTLAHKSSNHGKPHNISQTSIETTLDTTTAIITLSSKHSNSNLMFERQTAPTSRSSASENAALPGFGARRMVDCRRSLPTVTPRFHSETSSLTYKLSSTLFQSTGIMMCSAVLDCSMPSSLQKHMSNPVLERYPISTVPSAATAMSIRDLFMSLSIKSTSPDPTSVQAAIPTGTATATTVADPPSPPLIQRDSRKLPNQNKEGSNILIGAHALPTHLLISPKSTLTSHFADRKTSTSPSSPPYNADTIPATRFNPLSSDLTHLPNSTTPSTHPVRPTSVPGNGYNSTSIAIVEQHVDTRFLPYWGYPLLGGYVLSALWQFARALRGEVHVFAPMDDIIRGLGIGLD